MPVIPHPAELADLDLYAVWRNARLPANRLDPFLFTHRMAAYRELVRVSNPHGAYGDDNRRSPLWGLLFQHQWQYATGRLGADTAATGRIDPDAPWGYGNYTLSVVPWLGAVGAGLVEDRTILGPRMHSRFRYVDEGRIPAELRPGIAAWTSFFAHAAALRPGEDREPVRRELWRAHKVCLDVAAERLAQPDLSTYAGISQRELTFLRGWCRMVDYLWAAVWPTDFDFMSNHGLDVLPDVLLSDHDNYAEGLPDEVRRNVRNVLALAATPQLRYDVNLLLWRRIMRTRPARKDVVALLDAIFRPSRENVLTQARALGYLVRP